MLLGPVGSLEYLGNDEILVRGRVYNITKEMKALDFITIMNIDYSEKGDLRDTNFRWPYNISDMVMLDRNRIMLASDYLGLLIWNGAKDNAVLWTRKTELPFYMIQDTGKTVLCVMQDKKTLIKREITNGSVQTTELLPFAIIAKPLLMDDGNVLLMYRGGLAIIDSKLKITNVYQAVWIKEGSDASISNDGIYVWAPNKVARLKLQ